MATSGDLRWPRTASEASGSETSGQFTLLNPELFHVGLCPATALGARNLHFYQLSPDQWCTTL
jgi:hypothetical protein